MNIPDSNSQVALLDEQYHEAHRCASAIRARLAKLGDGSAGAGDAGLNRARELLEQMESWKRAILHEIEEIEDHMLD